MKKTFSTMLPILFMAKRFFSSARKWVSSFSLLAAALVLFGNVHPAGAFSFIRPQEPWMNVANGFNGPGSPYDTLLVGPGNLGEEYRRNTPVMYWACDNFYLDYFGSNGVRAVEQAFSAFNSVGGLSRYSLDLSEWPLESQRHNFAAQGLQLLDVKSQMMGAIIEQLGLSDPVRYTWVIHNRAHIANTPPCPDGMDYVVVQRNYDPVPSAPSQYQTSSYVNGTLYSYEIVEICTGSPLLADAVEFAVDPEADVYTSVADSKFGLDFGGFYLSLTRDDIGGMRYLLDTNNINFESIPPGSVEFETNQQVQLIFGSNLTLFAAQALTNNAAALQALYPGLLITSSTNFAFSNVFVTNVVGTLVPAPPWAPAGTFQLVFTTNVAFVGIQPLFSHTFGNIVTFQLVNGQWVAVPLTSVSQANGHQIINFQTSSLVISSPPFAPANTFSVVTNTVNRLRVQTGPVGEFFILGTGNFCDIQVLATQVTNVIAITNIIATATNTTVGSTNTLGGTNGFPGQVLSSTISLITFFTNHAFVILPVTCPGTNTTLFQGIDHVSFVRHDFDSLLGRFFQPITNDFVLNEITNGVVHSRSIRRIITQPDFVFSAADLIGGPSQLPLPFAYYARNINFNPPASAAAFNPNPPGTIEPPTQIVLNKSLPAFENFRIDPVRFLDELSRLPLGGWGSFDGTTNLPVVYPNGATITALENEVLLPISPDNLPPGQVGVEYTVQFSSLGGQPPLTFSLAPSSNPLPPGFSLAANGTFTGTPTVAGTFEFTIRLADSAGRTNDRLYTFVINP